MNGDIGFLAASAYKEGSDFDFNALYTCKYNQIYYPTYPVCPFENVTLTSNVFLPMEFDTSYTAKPMDLGGPIVREMNSTFE